jgi:hypothetical protein
MAAEPGEKQGELWPQLAGGQGGAALVALCKPAGARESPLGRAWQARQGRARERSQRLQAGRQACRQAEQGTFLHSLQHASQAGWEGLQPSAPHRPMGVHAASRGCWCHPRAPTLGALRQGAIGPFPEIGSHRRAPSQRIVALLQLTQSRALHPPTHPPSHHPCPRARTHHPPSPPYKQKPGAHLSLRMVATTGSRLSVSPVSYIFMSTFFRYSMSAAGKEERQCVQ